MSTWAAQQPSWILLNLLCLPDDYLFDSLEPFEWSNNWVLDYTDPELGDNFWSISTIYHKIIQQVFLWRREREPTLKLAKTLQSSMMM